MIYTSYFANMKNIPEDIARVSIALYPIKGWSGLECRDLTPKSEWIQLAKAGMLDEYRKLYNEKLNKLDADDIVEKLYDMTDAEDIVLLCYERPEDFCHRHIVAQWFNNAGYECEEWR